MHQKTDHPIFNTIYLHLSHQLSRIEQQQRTVVDCLMTVIKGERWISHRNTRRKLVIRNEFCCLLSCGLMFLEWYIERQSKWCSDMKSQVNTKKLCMNCHEFYSGHLKIWNTFNDKKKRFIFHTMIINVDEFVNSLKIPSLKMM